MSTRLIAVLTITVLAAVLMWHFQRQHNRAVRRRRRAMFDEVMPLLTESRLNQQNLDFPSLEGTYHGYQVRLRPLDDHLGYRKIPSLWLLVTVKHALPWRGVFDFLMRPENLEYYSPSGQLPYSIEIPSGWPQHAWLRTDEPAAMPPVERLAPYIADFVDLRTKELLVTPRGIRFVYQLCQADKLRYRIVRGVLFDEITVPAELARRLLDRLIELAHDLEQEARDGAAPA